MENKARNKHNFTCSQSKINWYLAKRKIQECQMSKLYHHYVCKKSRKHWCFFTLISQGSYDISQALNNTDSPLFTSMCQILLSQDVKNIQFSFRRYPEKLFYKKKTEPICLQRTSWREVFNELAGQTKGQAYGISYGDNDSYELRPYDF